MVDITPNREQMPSTFYSSILISLAQRENKNDYMEYVDYCVDECLSKHSDDVVVLNLLGEFLSHFLSNISLKWNWEKYWGCVEQRGYFVLSFMRQLFWMI
jgi:hypothetical protein